MNLPLWDASHLAVAYVIKDIEPAPPSPKQLVDDWCRDLWAKPPRIGAYYTHESLKDWGKLWTNQWPSD